MVGLLIYSKYKKVTNEKSAPVEAVSMIYRTPKNTVMKTSKENDENDESNFNLLDIHGTKDSILKKLGIKTDKEVKINDLDAIIKTKEVKINDLDARIESKGVKINDLDSVIETKKLLIESLNIDFLWNIKIVLDYICTNINKILQIFNIEITIPELIYSIILIWLFWKVIRLILKFIVFLFKIIQTLKNLIIKWKR